MLLIQRLMVPSCDGHSASCNMWRIVSIIYDNGRASPGRFVVTKILQELGHKTGDTLRNVGYHQRALQIVHHDEYCAVNSDSVKTADCATLVADAGRVMLLLGLFNTSDLPL